MEEEAYKTNLEGWRRFGPVEMTRKSKSKGRESRKHSTCERKNNASYDI